MFASNRWNLVERTKPVVNASPAQITPKFDILFYLIFNLFTASILSSYLSKHDLDDSFRPIAMGAKGFIDWTFRLTLHSLSLERELVQKRLQ